MNLRQLRALTGMLLAATLLHAFSAKAQSPFQDRTAVIAGHEVHYRIAGRGPTLLLLHGMPLTGEQWLPVAAQFTNRYTVIVAGLPGRGAYSRFAGEFRFGEAARTLHALLERIGPGRPYAVGFGAGATTLLHMAAQRPRRFEALILVEDPTGFGGDAMAQELYRALPHDNLRVISGPQHAPLWAPTAGSLAAADAFPQRVREFFAAATSSEIAQAPR